MPRSSTIFHPKYKESLNVTRKEATRGSWRPRRRTSGSHLARAVSLALSSTAPGSLPSAPSALPVLHSQGSSPPQSGPAPLLRVPAALRALCLSTCHPGDHGRDDLGMSSGCLCYWNRRYQSGGTRLPTAPPGPGRVNVLNCVTQTGISWHWDVLASTTRRGTADKGGRVHPQERARAGQGVWGALRPSSAEAGVPAAPYCARGSARQHLPSAPRIP